MLESGIQEDDKKQRNLVKWAQVITWIFFYVFLLLYMLQRSEVYDFGFRSATSSIFFYIATVYANANVLIPVYFKKGKRFLYFIGSLLLLIALTLLRMQADYLFLFPLHLKFYNWNLPHLSFVFITNFLAFLFGGLIRVFLDYLLLLGRQKEVESRQLASELNLLKSQVQPHFLFNTLNNIYFLAYTRSERTPEVIAKLSDIMRYFVDEAPKENVPIATEIAFLTNYIELEQIRLPYPVVLKIDIDNTDVALPVPPMLFIPLVENIFKHGIDKTKPGNTASIHLMQKNNQLLFCVTNLVPEMNNGARDGKGLINLRKRLIFLYGNDFVLDTQNNDQVFTATLKLPIWK